MKLRLIKDWKNKKAGAVGVFLSDFGQELIQQGIAEQLDDDFVVEEMPVKEETKQDAVYIPIPVPMDYFKGQEEEEIIKPKNK
jgi:hypothetical protein